MTLAPLHDAAFQSHRMFGRPVWSKEAPNHINSGSPEAGAGRLNQYVVTVGWLSKRFEGYGASIFARLTVWSMGARRRESPQSKLAI